MKSLALILILLTQTQLPTISWTLEDLGFSDIIVENTLRGYETSVSFSSELTGYVIFKVIIYANVSLTLKIIINNITKELRANEQSTFEGILYVSNTLKIVIPPQLPSRPATIFKNSTIVAMLNVPQEDANQAHMNKNLLRYLFWILILAPPLLIYLYERTMPKTVSEGEEVILT